MNCALAHLQLHPYLDGELAVADALCLEAHLIECDTCRREFEAVQVAVETVRGANSLYEPPEASRARVSELIASHHRRRMAVRIAAVAAILAAGLVFARSVSERLASPDSLAELAVESHLRYARGILPLDIRSQEPQTVARWVSNRVPFQFTLPNYPAAPGETKKYVLAGARLLQLGHADVAYLAYSMDGRPISLLLTSSRSSVPSGGEVYYSGGLAFHTSLYKGRRVTTWSDKGLNYALVSELATAGAESCMVCHGSDAGHDRFPTLKPRL